MSSEEKKDYEVIIGTPENVQPEIEEILESYGFRNHSRMTSERWDELMKMFAPPVKKNVAKKKTPDMTKAARVSGASKTRKTGTRAKKR